MLKRYNFLLIIILYTIGIALYSLDLTYEFAKKSTEPFLFVVNIYLLVTIIPRYKKSYFITLSFLAFLVTFICEILGANYGWIFGSYTYGNLFRITLFDVPIIIGINWVLLILASTSLSRFIIKNNSYLHSLIAGIIMVLLDYLIEPVAIHLNYWRWEGGKVPLQNYLAWFLLSAIFVFVFRKFRVVVNEKILNVFLLLNFLFFGLLNLIIL